MTCRFHFNALLAWGLYRNRSEALFSSHFLLLGERLLILSCVDIKHRAEDMGYGMLNKPNTHTF